MLFSCRGIDGRSYGRRASRLYYWRVTSAGGLRGTLDPKPYHYLTPAPLRSHLLSVPIFWFNIASMRSSSSDPYRVSSCGLTCVNMRNCVSISISITGVETTTTMMLNFSRAAAPHHRQVSTQCHHLLLQPLRSPRSPPA